MNPRFAPRRPRPATARPATARPDRAGFTLIEMLIAVALVLLMMLLFGEVFRLATETVSVRKGMAQNDQKARLLATRVRTDLDARTFRQVVPYAGWVTRFDTLYDAAGNLIGWEPRRLLGGPGGAQVVSVGGNPVAEAGPQPTATANFDPSRRLGYFTISENDPDDDTDDSFALTTDRRNLNARGDVTRDFALGRAAKVRIDGTLFAGGGPLQADQPDFDEFTDIGNPADAAGPLTDQTTARGQAFLRNVADGAAESPVEEVVYFLRDGNLIRGRRLVRAAPTDHDDLFSPDGDDDEPDWPPTGNGSFWRFMDLAAFRHPAAYVGGTQRGPRLHDLDSLKNVTDGDSLFADLTGVDGDEAYPRSLGLPQLRYGHGWTRYGRPREFSLKAVGNGGLELPALTFASDAEGAALVGGEWAGSYVGRFLAQEAAHDAFLYPGRSGAIAGDPFHRPDLAGAGYFLPPNRSAPRGDLRGEEILISNVHGFDVEVYDEALREFVDLGHARTVAAPDVFDVDGDGEVGELLDVAGDFHRDRLLTRTPMGTPVFDPDRNGTVSFDLGGSDVLDAHPYGNRFDTWHPDARLVDAGKVPGRRAGTTIPVDVSRPYPPPYRPLKNPLGGDVGVPLRDFGGDLLVRTADGLSLLGPDLSLTRTPTGRDARNDMDFLMGAVRDGQTGNVATAVLVAALGATDPALPLLDEPGDEGDDDGEAGRGPDDVPGTAADDPPFADFAATPVSSPAFGNERLFPDPNEIGRLGSDDEKALRAVRITVRFYDVASERMREVSFRHGLLD